MSVVQSIHEQLRERLEEHRESKDPEPLSLTAGEVGGILSAADMGASVRKTASMNSWWSWSAFRA